MSAVYAGTQAPRNLFREAYPTRFTLHVWRDFGRIKQQTPPDRRRMCTAPGVLPTVFLQGLIRCFREGPGSEAPHERCPERSTVDLGYRRPMRVWADLCRYQNLYQNLCRYQKKSLRTIKFFSVRPYVRLSALSATANLPVTLRRPTL